MGEVLEIRRMTAPDVDDVARIESVCFRTPWSRADFVYEMVENPVARYFVARTGGETVGFAGMHVILDEGHVINVAVIPQCRGKGIGRALMDVLTHYAANLGVRYLTLEVRVSNAAAIRLYGSLGFLRVSVRKKYYQDTGEDAYLMVCDRMPAPDADFFEPETTTD